jgi:hypothetical protein
MLLALCRELLPREPWAPGNGVPQYRARIVRTPPHFLTGGVAP